MGSKARCARCWREFDSESDSCLSRDLFLKIIYSLYHVESHRDSDASIAYEAMDSSGDLKKDAVFQSTCSCKSNSVRVMCVGSVGVCVRT